MTETPMQRRERYLAHANMDAAGMVKCAKSGCIHCHRTLLARIRLADEQEGRSRELWGETYKGITPGRQEYLRLLQEYAAYRVAHPVKAPRGRKQKHHVELEREVALARHVLDYMEKHPEASEEASWDAVALREHVSDSTVKQAYKWAVVKTNK